MLPSTERPVSTTEYESFLDRHLPFELEILVGVVCGGVVFVALICTAVACCVCRRREHKSHLERKAQRVENNYLDVSVPIDIGNAGQVAEAKRKLQRGKPSVNISKLISNSMARKVHNIDGSRLNIGEVLGSGKFGVVYKAELKDKNMENPTEVALKTMQGEDCSEKEMQSFLDEVIIMHRFRHQNVLAMLGLSVVDDKPYAVLPFMDNGDLKSYIQDSDKNFVIKELLEFSNQVVNGMVYLSQQGFVHRDLAARNCMVDKELVVKIADFGLSRDIFTEEYYRMENLNTPLPVRWMAVESLERQVFTHMSDVWSFGILMWEVMCRGKTPYPDRDNVAVIKYVKAGNRLSKPLFLPDDIYDMMKSCWHEVPKKRPTFSEVSTRLTKLLGTNQSRPYVNLLGKKNNPQKK